ncbi:hypothetical protein G9A89_007509 [Geosiphon pyriformis]|nr:hypothetical protein G9A89_007509 [Geosiphon pyriformis]
MATTPYIRLNAPWPKAPKRVKCITIIKTAIVLVIFAMIVFFSTCELHLNMRVYVREWVAKEEFPNENLYGCFDNISNENLTKPIYNEVHPAVPLTNGWDCYDFADGIQTLPGQPKELTTYHTYWRADLRPLGDKQVATLRSFFATQDANFSSLVLWSNGDLSKNEFLQPFFERFPDRFQTRIYNPAVEAKGTAIEPSPNLKLQDKHAYLDGDLIRLLVLYKYGGVWFDMDSLFIRDLSPLTEHEWVGQWDCFLPDGFPLNGAFMRFRENSPYVCEFLAEMAHGPPPRKDTIDWGSRLYYKVFRRLIQNGKKPFKVLPWCFTDPSVCHPSNSMPSAFKEEEFNKEKLRQVFAYHWHNQWDRKKGTLFRYLEGLHDEILGF